MLAEDVPGEGLSARTVLDRLIRARQPDIGRYALFFVTDEGEPEEDGAGEGSGSVITSQGKVYEFIVQWGQGQRMGRLTDWQEVTPQPHWRASEEYQAARASVGLSRA